MKPKLPTLLLVMLAGWINRLSYAKTHLTANVSDLSDPNRSELLFQK